MPNLAALGFPFADVAADGTATFSKLPDTGGLLNRATVREQLLYEVTDPGAYLTPDVTLDLNLVTVTECGPDRVAVAGAVGRPRPDQLKVTVGYRAGRKVEAEISYSGPGAFRRATLAADIIAARLQKLPLNPRIEVFGATPVEAPEAAECRLRVAALTTDTDLLDIVGHEVEALYTNGPAGGGGVRVHTTDVIGVVSTLVARSATSPSVTILEAAGARPAA